MQYSFQTTMLTAKVKTGRIVSTITPIPSFFTSIYIIVAFRAIKILRKSQVADSGLVEARRCFVATVTRERCAVLTSLLLWDFSRDKRGGEGEGEKEARRRREGCERGEAGGERRRDDKGNGGCNKRAGSGYKRADKKSVGEGKTKARLRQRGGGGGGAGRKKERRCFCPPSPVF